MIFVSGAPLARIYDVVLLALTPYGPLPAHTFHALFHTLRACAAFAQQLDSVTPYLVGCVGWH